jgi:chromosome segregation ATPase
MTLLPLGLAGQPLLIVLALVLSALLVLVMGAVAWSFDLRRGRLPQATACEDLNERNVALAGQLAEKKMELQEINRQIQERDRIAAEVAVLTNQRDELRLELSGLDEGRRQVEEVKQKAAEAATEYVEARGKLEEARSALAEVEERRATIEREHERMMRELSAAQDDVGRLRAEVEASRTERAALDHELAPLREELPVYRSHCYSPRASLASRK